MQGLDISGAAGLLITTLSLSQPRDEKKMIGVRSRPTPQPYTRTAPLLAHMERDLPKLSELSVYTYTSYYYTSLRANFLLS